MGEEENGKILIIFFLDLKMIIKLNANITSYSKSSECIS